MEPGVSADKGPIDASYVQCATEYVAYMHEQELTEDHPEFAFASSTKSDGRPQATSCREILEYKRSGVWGFGKIKPINILVGNSTGIAFAKCATKRSKLRHIDCRQRWVQALHDCTICDLVKVGTDDNLSDIFTKILGQTSLSLCEIV